MGTFGEYITLTDCCYYKKTDQISTRTYNPIVVELFYLKPQCQPIGGTKEKVWGLWISEGFILWEPRMHKNLMATHLIFVWAKVVDWPTHKPRLSSLEPRCWHGLKPEIYALSEGWKWILFKDNNCAMCRLDWVISFQHALFWKLSIAHYTCTVFDWQFKSLTCPQYTMTLTQSMQG